MDRRPELAAFSRYMMKNWIGRIRPNGTWTKPAFEYELWNIRDSFLREIPSTNCAIEAFNKTFQETLLKTHPSVCLFSQNFRGFILKVKDFVNFREGVIEKSKKIYNFHCTRCLKMALFEKIRKIFKFFLDKN